MNNEMTEIKSKKADLSRFKDNYIMEFSTKGNGSIIKSFSLTRADISNGSISQLFVDYADKIIDNNTIIYKEEECAVTMNGLTVYDIESELGISIDDIRKEISNKDYKMYKIPVDYTMFGDMYIRAKSLKEAKEMAIYEAPLPKDEYYMEDSIRIDEVILEEYREGGELRV